MLGGVTLVGRYRLDRKLGAGAMGEVWHGIDTRLNRDVAVKVFPEHSSVDTRRAARFRAEAQLCGQIQHPGVVVVHDANDDEGRLFFVMEMLDGRDLRAVMDDARNGLPFDRIIRIGIGLADALAAAHAKKVIHRDIKPANIMLLPGDRPKLLDFGIAKVLDAGGATAPIGTPAYTAPEQNEGRPDERSDLYSLGCVLYEMTTGDRPFEGGAMEVLYKHATKQPPRPGDFRGDVPSLLEELILDLLAKKPEDRPQSADEVTTRLRAIHQTDPGPAKATVLLPDDRLLRSGASERLHSDVDEAMARAIDQVLRRSRIDARVADYVRTPQLTRFEVRLGPNVHENAVMALVGEFVRVTGQDGLRALPMRRSTSPLPGVPAIGVEVPHRVPDALGLGDILREAPDAHAQLAGLGRAADGTAVFFEPADTPHLLIGGRGGQVDPLRVIVASFAMRHSPHDLRLVFAAPGSPFATLPHVVRQADGDPLTWAVAEVACRYDDLRAHGCRTTAQLNDRVRETGGPVPAGALGDSDLAHPDVVVVIDEIDDVSPDSVVELTMEGRAVGFHVVARMGRPSEHADVSRVKGYFPARLALPLTSVEESIAVIDRAGAETLRTGTGLFSVHGGQPGQIGLAAISDQEVAAIIGHWIT
ncbi:serine/threonine protein kinase [Herbidospora galbida]|uniref:serine/threonine protein kinase n=1 Tax=Herbidospora galbida TaxID=2575442 RepID=UPI001484FAB7|nr:serine/threonine protein kinase [Herbidospora galbida]